MAVDMFLKIAGVDGESHDFKHKNEIDVESFSWGVLQASAQDASSGVGAATGKASIQDFHFTGRVSKASPVLMLACAAGKHIPEATLTVRKAGEQQQEFIQYKFSDVLISSYQTGGAGGDVVPVDSFSLNFSKIEFEYTPFDDTGKPSAPVTGGFDVKSAKNA